MCADEKEQERRRRSQVCDAGVVTMPSHGRPRLGSSAGGKHTATRARLKVQKCLCRLLTEVEHAAASAESGIMMHAAVRGRVGDT